MSGSPSSSTSCSWQARRSAAREFLGGKFGGEAEAIESLMFASAQDSINKGGADVYEKLVRERFFKQEEEKMETSGDFMVKCIECGAGTVEFVMVQERSADEAQTARYHCTTCNKRWKE